MTVRRSVAVLAVGVLSAPLLGRGSRFDGTVVQVPDAGVPGRAGKVVTPRADTASPGSGVTYRRLLDAGTDSTAWLTYSGSYSGQRYSVLEGIDRRTVSHLSLAWVHQLPTLGRVESTPLVADGVMYVTYPPGGVAALDVETGRSFWTHSRRPSGPISACCGMPNRGVALLGERVFVGTMDGHLLALDMRTGRVDWDVVVADPKRGFSITGAPLALKDMVITGVGGGEFGIRGFIDAYAADSGRRRWRFYTVPGPGRPGHDTWAGESWKSGGGPTWLTGSYDPELDLLYWGVGNPSPPFDGRARPGDNLYTNSVVALEPDDGKLRWHFQFTPHDTHDWDAVQIPVLADIRSGGRRRSAILWANRNGFFYVLDRDTGQFRLARSFARQTWAERIDENGRPVVKPNITPTPEGVWVSPPSDGATNWWSPSYSPRTGLLYVTAKDGVEEFHRSTTPPDEDTHLGSAVSGTVDSAGAVRAIDPRTGRVRWEYSLRLIAPSTVVTTMYRSLSEGGLLSTAGGLVFGGTDSGRFFALDAATGKELWHRNLGGQIVAAPITFSHSGTQYVCIAAGHAIFAFALRK